MDKESLFRKYGGFETISKLVMEFYKKVLADNELKEYFKDVKMDKLMEHQVAFISHALGGPNTYKGKDLKVAHTKLDITEKHFFQVAEYLQETLEESGVEDHDTKAIIQLIASLKDQIVSDKVDKKAS